jgi:hypothetical protein
MVPSVRTISRRYDDDARVLRQDDDEDDEKWNAGNVHGLPPADSRGWNIDFDLIAKRLASVMVIFYHMKRFACNL